MPFAVVFDSGHPLAFSRTGLALPDKRVRLPTRKNDSVLIGGRVWLAQSRR